MTLSLWVTLFQFYFISSLSISRNQLADSWKWQKIKESSEAKVGHKLGWFMVVFSVICISFPMIQNTLRGLSLFTAPSSQQEFGVYWADKGFLSSAPLSPKLFCFLLQSFLGLLVSCQLPLNLLTGWLIMRNWHVDEKFTICSLNPAKSLKKSLWSYQVNAEDK